MNDLNILLNSKNLYYAGIGSRKTPKEVQLLMSKISEKLEIQQCILRSGGAGGADTAFENGIKNLQNSEIYIPWPTFNNKKIKLDSQTQSQVISIPLKGKVLENALSIAEKFHPAWNKCSRPAKLLHIRNVFQILGKNLNQISDLVICWTSNGEATGGTGQALRIAKSYNVPIINLQKTSERDIIMNWLNPVANNFVNNLFNPSLS